MSDIPIDDGSDKPLGYQTPDGELEVREINGERGYHETELGQHQRWMRSAPDLFEKYAELQEAKATAEARVQKLECELAKAKEDGDESAVMLSQLNDEHCALEARLLRVEQERDKALKVLDPNMPESGLVDACKQVKQVAISEADNSEKLEAALARAEQEREEYKRQVKVVYDKKMAEIGEEITAREAAEKAAAETLRSMLALVEKLMERGYLRHGELCDKHSGAFIIRNVEGEYRGARSREAGDPPNRCNCGLDDELEASLLSSQETPKP